jgi:uncharacterized zinc-type alcohol dehydrogenase-like protein
MKTVKAHAAREARAELEDFSYEVAALRPHDVEIEITHCGLCHSDVHLIDDAWNRSVFPLVPGHEIVGTVTAAGPLASFAPGRRVGVGWQRSACLECELCADGQENLCAAQEATCVGHYGGLAERITVDGRFAFAIPHDLPSAAAAPLLCGGVTVYAPLARFGVGAGHRVGVIGIGGLGQIAIRMLRALGCSVTAFSSSPDKRDALAEMGATDVASSTDAREVRRHKDRFDFLLSTVHARLDWTTYLQTLRPNGVLCLLGVPPGLMQIPASLLVTGQRAIVGSDIGSRAEVAETLSFAARHRIEPQIESMPMNQVNRAIERLRRNEVRYRAVLERAAPVN